MKENRIRKFINDIHLWLGLASGIVLFIVCLSGTIYTFRSEIEYCINPDKYNSSYNPTITTEKKALKVEELISRLEKQEKGKVTAITLPENLEKNYQFAVVKKEANKKGNKVVETPPQRSRPITFYVDPYTGKVKGKDGDGASKFFTTMMKLHRWLLLDDSIGRPIVGIATLIFLVLCISGIVLWVPKKLKQWRKWSYWKPGFKIKWRANWKRINHDLHNTLGFYSLIFLLIMALTGLCWSFEWYKEGVSKVMGAEVFAGRNEKPKSIEYRSSKTISVEEIIKVSDRELPYLGTVKINLPKDPAQALTVTKNKNGFATLSASDKLSINPYTSEVIEKDLFKNKPLNVQLVSLIKPIHLGEVYGTLSKIIYFITCLIGTSLPITGFFVWWNKIKKSKK